MEERQEERVEEDNMIRDVGTKAFAQAHVYETMSVNAETPLYVSPTKLMRINVLQNCSCSWMKCFSREILYPLEIMTPRRFFVWWV